MNASTRRILDQQAARELQAMREQEAMLRKLARRLGEVHLPSPMPLRYSPFAEPRNLEKLMRKEA